MQVPRLPWNLHVSGIISYADIIAIAARNLVLMIGGPSYTVKLGRKDSLTSTAYTVDGQSAENPRWMNQIIQNFQSRGFSVQEMVALSGTHTIGFSHCKEFSSTLYNYSKTSEFAPTLSVFNDVMSPNKFDNMYFQNLLKGLGEAPWYWDENGRVLGVVEWGYRLRTVYVWELFVLLLIWCVQDLQYEILLDSFFVGEEH
ncbi:Peroxidase 63 [Abeliophyllum distichum]|uniref:peroxidase n=1 Tax=Abeliophyllum distichum TaxID=126358 RepID=A0ABD1R806_9LAMI